MSSADGRTGVRGASAPATSEPTRPPASRSEHAGRSGVPRPRPRRLTAEELAVWRLFLRAHAGVMRRLEVDVMSAHGLPLASYDVLVQLVEAPGHALRMTELADAVLLSRSGLTRLVDRLERDGLVRREPCLSDARGLNAVLTPEGYNRLRAASPTHLRGIDDYVISRLTPDELTRLGAILAKLAD